MQILNQRILYLEDKVKHKEKDKIKVKLFEKFERGTINDMRLSCAHLGFFSL
jgi:hypothetical protein